MNITCKETSTSRAGVNIPQSAGRDASQNSRLTCYGGRKIGNSGISGRLRYPLGIVNNGELQLLYAPMDPREFVRDPSQCIYPL